MSDPVIPPTDLDAAPRGRAATRQTWVERLRRFAASGLSGAQFCAQEGLALPSFYAWKRRLATEPPGCTAGARAAGAHPPRLLPVHLASAAAAVEVLLPGGVVLQLRPGCDLSFVRAVVDALGGAP